MTARPTSHSPFPAGTTLVPDPSLRVRNRGRLLLGGAPLRVLRLTAAGAEVVRAWLGGAPVERTPGVTALARRLVSAGIFHPQPPPDGAPHPMTVVIPVRDDADGVATTVAGLCGRDVVVVDDGSEPALDGAGLDGITVLRRRVSGGPGQARQDAVDSGIATPLVAFVDAGVSVTGADLDRLSRWFADPDVVAVAPRVLSPTHPRPSAAPATAGDPAPRTAPATDRDPGAGTAPASGAAPGPGARTIAGYEADHSPLDMGPTPSPVAPGRMVAYVPTACLLVRTDALEAVGGFDRTLRYGEDVDLVWRLGDHGEVRYDPTVVVGHPPRPSLGRFLQQRFSYGSSSGPLAARHGARLAPARLSRWSLAVWLLALAGHLAAALGLASLSAFLLRRKLRFVVPDAGVEAVRLTTAGHWWAGVQLADAAVRAWWPATLLLSLTRARRLTLPLLALAWGRRLLRADGDPADRLVELAIGVADDGAYGAGVWRSALRERTARGILPQLAEWPGREPLDGG